MPNPQEPELRRSGRVPALSPDATEAARSADRREDPTSPRGPIPPEQRPGHHPPQEQDKPDLDAVADRMGVVPTSEKESWRRMRSPYWWGIAAVGLVGGLASALARAFGRRNARKSSA